MNRSKAGASIVDSDARVVLDAIRHVVRALRFSSREAQERVGLSAAQLFVLQKLTGSSAISVGDLAARTLTDQSSVSVVASRLVQRGLVTRRRSKLDARRVELAITARGRRLLARAPPDAADDHLIGALERLAPTPRRQLAHGLRALLTQMSVGKGRPNQFFESDTAARDSVRRTRRRTA